MTFIDKADNQLTQIKRVRLRHRQSPPFGSESAIPDGHQPRLGLEFAARQGALFAIQRVGEIPDPAVQLEDCAFVLGPLPGRFDRKKEETEDLALRGRIPNEGAAILEIEDKVPQ
jgi:hypothetical protein